MSKLSNNKFENIDGLRTFAAISIIIMHISANMGFPLESSTDIQQFIFENIINRFTIFVSLFFAISGFGMCCGYYEKIKNKALDVNSFYNKRYFKIFPFFMFLIAIDVLISIFISNDFSLIQIFDVIANSTLMFGLFPAYNTTIIGVGWTLGVIFGFYIIFPFFVYMLWNKKRAWFSLSVAIAVNYMCSVYFRVGGQSVAASTVRWLCYFICGGIIYLYKDDICRFYNKCKKAGVFVSLTIVVLGMVMLLWRCPNFKNFFAGYFYYAKDVVACALILIGALGKKNCLMSNKFTTFISGISLEIYLSHMMIFRFIQMVKFDSFIGNELLVYFILCILTIVSTIAFSHVYKIVESKINKLIKK